MIVDMIVKKKFIKDEIHSCCVLAKRKSSLNIKDIH